GSSRRSAHPEERGAGKGRAALAPPRKGGAGEEPPPPGGQPRRGRVRRGGFSRSAVDPAAGGLDGDSIRGGGPADIGPSGSHSGSRTEDCAMVSMEELLNQMVQRGGSDLHLSVGAPPKIRIDGRLVDTDYEALTPEVGKKLVYSVLGPDQVAKFEKNLELDFSFGVANLGRFRTNAF